MTSENEEKIKEIFKNEGGVKLAYFFGSRARGDAGQRSDYDFAVYLDSRDVKKNYAVKFSLMDKLSRLFKTDKIDLVVLDDSRRSELKYNIIKEGRIVYEEEPYRVIVEPKIMNEYFDFRLCLKYNNLKKYEESGNS